MTQAKQTETPAFKLDTAEAVARRDLESATELRTALLAELAAGTDVTEKLTAIEEEIAQHQRALRRFAEARAVAVQASTSSAKQARHEQALSRLAEGIRGAEELTQQCMSALLVLAELKGHLDVIDGQRAAVAGLLHDVARDAVHGAPSERVAQDMHDQLRYALDALTLRNAFVMATWDSGLGRRGVQLSEDFVQVRRPMEDTQNDPTADSQSALARVRALVQRMAEWSANANGVKAA